MRKKRMFVAGALAAALVASAVFSPATVFAQEGMDVAGLGTVVPDSSAEGDLRLPLQQALSEALAVQSAAGSAGPADVQFHSEIQAGETVAAGQEQSYTLTGTTVVSFDNPQQAGLDAWPALVVSEVQPAGATGVVQAGDYSAHLRDMLAQELPGIWDAYEFGQEPRRYTYTERITVRYPQTDAATAYTSQDALATDVERDLLFGFATTGPDWDYTLDEEWETCFIVCVTAASARVGFALDWAVGLHLPVAIEQTSQSPMVFGSNPISVTMRGMDWTPSQLAALPYGLAGDDEFVLSFEAFAGAQATIAGVRVVNLGFDGDFESTRSFATPMGAGAAFPIPTQIFPASSTGLEWGVSGILAVGLGLSIDPELETGGVTANWTTQGDAQGSGSLLYELNNAPYQYANIEGGDFDDTSAAAEIYLEDIRYTFDRFALGLGACPEFTLIGFGTQRVCVSLPALNLSSITGGLYLTPFEGSSSLVFHRVLVEGTYYAYLPALQEGP